MTTISDLTKIEILRQEFAALKDAINKLDNKKDEVVVSNLRELVAPLARVLSKNSKDSQRIIQEIRIPDNIKIDDFKKVEVALLALAKVLKNKEFNPTINVESPEVNIPEIKVPQINIPRIDVPQPIVNVPQQEVDIDLTDLIRALAPLKFLSNKATKPISVRMSDGKSFVKALKDLEKATTQQITAYSTNVAMTLDEYKSVSGTPGGFKHKKVTVTSAGTPVNVSTTNVACREVYLTADTDAGIICVVGGTNAVRATTNNKNGMIIIPGNAPTTIRTSDLKNLWVDSENDGGILCVSYAT